MIVVETIVSSGRVGRGVVLVVDALADPGLRRDQVDAEDVVGGLVLVEVVPPEHAVQEQLLDLGVVGGLVCGCEAVAEHGDIELRPRWTRVEDLRDTVGHPGSFRRVLGRSRRPCSGRVTAYRSSRPSCPECRSNFGPHIGGGSPSVACSRVLLQLRGSQRACRRRTLGLQYDHRRRRPRTRAEPPALRRPTCTAGSSSASGRSSGSPSPGRDRAGFRLPEGVARSARRDRAGQVPAPG